MNTLLLLVFAPVALGLAGLFLPTALKKLLGTAALLGNLVLAARFFSRPPAPLVVGGVPLLEITPLSRVIVLFLSLVGFLVYVYALSACGRGARGRANVNPEYEDRSLLLILLATGFSLGAAAGGHIITFLVFWGLSGLALYFYALLPGRAAADTAKKTFLMIGGSDLLLLVGLALLWQAGGGEYRLFAVNQVLDGAWTYAAFFSLVLAALAKAGAFPLHTWVPGFSRDAPVEGAALLPAAFDKLLGVYLLALVMNGMFVLPPALRFAVMLTGALGIVVAVMMALVQHNGRRLLGYHAVSQAGYMVLGLGVGGPLGLAGALFHLLNNVLYKTGLFLSLGAVEKRTGASDLERLGGLGRFMPWTCLSTLACALAISGLPPFNGFVSKWLIYQSLVAGAREQAAWGQGIFLFCLAAAVFGSGLTLASFLKFLYTLYFGKRAPAAGVEEIGLNNRLVTLSLAALCLGLGIFAYPAVLGGLLQPLTGGYEVLAAYLPGFYRPYTVTLLLAAALILASLAYLGCRKLRFDAGYVGGQEDRVEFMVNGTRFYDTVRGLAPLNRIYSLAERKYFDLYHWVGNLVGRCGLVLQKRHTGLFPTYMSWTVFGLILVLLMVAR